MAGYEHMLKRLLLKQSVVDPSNMSLNVSPPLSRRHHQHESERLTDLPAAASSSWMFPFLTFSAFRSLHLLANPSRSHRCPAASQEHAMINATLRQCARGLVEIVEFSWCLRIPIVIQHVGSKLSRLFHHCRLLISGRFGLLVNDL